MQQLIDAHRHFTIGESDGNDLLEEMDRDGIEQTILFGYHGLEHEQLHAQDQAVAALHDAYPDRIIPFITDIDISNSDFTEYVSNLLEGSIFRGIGELLLGHDLFHRQFFPSLKLDDPAVRELFSLAAGYGVPVLMHVDTPYMDQFERLLAACPKTICICPHLAYHFLEPFGGHEVEQQVVAHLLESYENLYFDISLWKISPIYLQDEAWLHLLEDRSDRLMFGTDMTGHYTRQSVWLPAYRAILDQLSPSAAENIGRNTIKGIL